MRTVIARELLRAAKEMAVQVVITIPRTDGVDSWAYNDIHFAAQKFLDKIRENERLESFLSRFDNEGEMRLEAGFSDHDQTKAIIRELATRTARACEKYGIGKVFIGVTNDEAAQMVNEALSAVRKANEVLHGDW